jgi:hypothetical protein
MKTRKRCASRHMIQLAATAGALLAALALPAAAADSVRWRTIVGIEDAGANGNNAVGGIMGGGQAWTTLGGQARVDLDSGHIEFEVRGLVLNGGNAIGTPDAINQVKGTLVCAAGAANQAVVDTPLVTLTAQGDAEFEGDVAPLPAVCTPQNVAFLVRIAAGRWIANGAVRTP